MQSSSASSFRRSVRRAFRWSTRLTPPHLKRWPPTRWRRPTPTNSAETFSTASPRPGERAMSLWLERMGLLARVCERTIDGAAAVLVFAIAALVFAQVIVRYVLGGSLVWSEELTRVLFVWMVLLAASTAEPMRIDFVLQALPIRVAAAVSIVAES